MAETEYFEKTPNKANRWFVAFVVFALLYGITFSLFSIFNWIFFLAAAYSLFMSYFLLPVQPKIFQRRPKQERFSQGSFNTGSRAGASQASKSPEARSKIVIKIVIGMVAAFILIQFVIGFVEGISDSDETTSVTEASSDNDPDAGSYSPEQHFVVTGNNFFNDQQYDSADRYYDLALEEDHNNMEAVYGKGIVLYNRDRKDEAITYFVKAYDGGFRYAWLSWVLGDMNDKQGRTDRAISFYKETLNLDSTYSEVYMRLAELEPSNRERYLELAQKYPNN